MKSCIIFGGSGFIGQNLIKMLLKDNYFIKLYDRNFRPENLEKEKNLKYIKGDFFEENNFDRYLKDVDVVIHLISSVSPSSSMEDIYSPYENDVVKTIELLEASRRNHIKRMIFISSGGTVYGDSEKKCNENEKTNPINNYGIMKLTIEKILLMYNRIYNMENIILRVSNPYGPYQDPSKNIGAISVFTSKILKNKTITIFGDGENIRDYVHIEDVCKGIINSITYTFMDNIEPVFNIGSGIGYSLNEVIKILEKTLNKKANIEYIEKRNLDVRKNILDIEKAYTYLNYKTYFDLNKGIYDFLLRI